MRCKVNIKKIEAPPYHAVATFVAAPTCNYAQIRMQYECETQSSQKKEPRAVRKNNPEYKCSWTQSSQKKDARGVPRASFLTAFSFSRFEAHFSSSVWGLTRESIWGPVCYGLRTTLTDSWRECSLNTFLNFGRNSRQFVPWIILIFGQNRARVVRKLKTSRCPRYVVVSFAFLPYTASLFGRIYSGGQ